MLRYETHDVRMHALLHCGHMGRGGLALGALSQIREPPNLNTKLRPNSVYHQPTNHLWQFFCKSC
jgi:hypothetical protein